MELFWVTSLLGVIIIAVLYNKYPSFRYRFKFFLYIGGYSIIALCTIPFCLFRPWNVENSLISVPAVKLLSRLLGIRCEISGKEILEKDFPCVVICNHQSILDVVVTVELWPIMKKCAGIAKKEIRYVFPFGTMSWLCGTIFINRRNSKESQMKLSATAETIREKKIKLWIFPEGTRSKKEELLPFKKGAFHIAMMNKLPIVPVVISPYYFIDDNKKTFNSGTMQIKIMEPIDTSNLQYPEDVSKLTQNCQELMNLEFQKMKKEMKITKKE